MRSSNALAAGMLAAILAASAARAAQLDFVDVTSRDNRFHIIFDGVVEAPVARVHEVLVNYAHLGRLNPAITSTDVAATPTGDGDRVRSVVESCVLFFCREVVQVEDVIQPDPQTIVARIVPGAGDFENGSALWRLSDEGRRTRVHYEATRAAAFWIPPLIGPWAIRHTMRDQLEQSMANLERLANRPR